MSAARRRWPEGASAASGQLQLRAVHSTKHEARVGTRHPVVVAAVDLVGVDQAQPRLGADVPLHPEQVVDRVIFAAGRAGPVVHGGEERQVGTERLAGEFGGRHWLNDPAGIDQLVGCGELLDAIEKERPLLGEEDFLPGIEGKLLCVGLDLGEIRIGGAIQREVVGDAPADRGSKLARNEALARLAGAQESSCPECCTCRTMLMPQLCSSFG